MATNCTIWVKDDSSAKNKYRGIFCKWDGYYDYNGEALNRFYKDPKKIFQLINLGDIVSLGAVLTHEEFEKLDEDSPEYEWGVTEAYHRDRKDNYHMFITNDDDEFINIAKQHEYVYYFDLGKNKWYACKYPEDLNDFKELDSILNDVF